MSPRLSCYVPLFVKVIRTKKEKKKKMRKLLENNVAIAKEMQSNFGKRDCTRQNFTRVAILVLFNVKMQ